jgi:SAM-dependent methyltransferase
MVRGMESRTKQLVATGYDQIAEQYLEWPAGNAVRARYLARLLGLIGGDAQVLDLGCGAGIPVARELSYKANVLGLDLSPRQIELARQNVPTARFIVGDMITAKMPSNHFDAICAFFSITHLPRDQHLQLLQLVTDWLRPGGVFVASLGAKAAADMIESNWLGVPMFFSHFDAVTNLDLVRMAGLQVSHHEILSHDEDGKSIQFLWLVAHKPVAPG